ncbi:MAG: acyl-ACP--UDP-N-acetylglucosamine O-acyltransferase [Bacteroidetes bacterium]|nr:acyl-ACP--UDP-N-acetylglucosamine O-acyltransferase [Bacteroidota bacterium]MCL5737171.1 acyl-ACP--UDP-N-acetylglucosamine O-acyltransferase [Bacteroidota bacterium]
MATLIDPRAVVSPKAQLGNGVTIGPFTVVEEDVVIGDDSKIASSAYIANGARIGKNCRIHHGAVVSNAPQDLKYANEPTLFEVGDNVVIREFCTLHRGTVETGKTVLGSDCLLMAYVHIAHDCRVGNKCIFANNVTLAGHVEVGDWVTIGGLTPIHQFVHVGAHVMIGGGFRAVQDVPPYVLAGREPLRYEGINLIGLRRRGFTREQIENIEDVYRVIYSSGLMFSEAIKKIDAEFPKTAEVNLILNFLKTSSRGIIRK